MQIWCLFVIVIHTAQVRNILHDRTNSPSMISCGGGVTTSPMAPPIGSTVNPGIFMSTTPVSFKVTSTPITTDVFIPMNISQLTSAMLSPSKCVHSQVMPQISRYPLEPSPCSPKPHISAVIIDVEMLDPNEKLEVQSIG